jgi:dTDP-4-dehydrorhamnose reductase
MRIAVTGATGQLGRAFQEVAGPRHDLVLFGGATSPGGIDLRDTAGTSRAIEAARPDWVLHAGALTNVDGCERDPDAAHRINALGTQAVAQAAARCGADLVAVSTDYVFDGERGNYTEEDAARPRSVYGRTKLEGERLATAALPGAIVARTSVVFGPHKKNFVSWLRDELMAGRHVPIVRDQRVNPTFSYDLAEQVLALMQADASGLFHTAGATSLSRLEMAYAVADHFGLPRELVTAVRSDELSWVAPRPRDATLNTTKVSRFKRPMAFPDALRRLDPVPA